MLTDKVVLVTGAAGGIGFETTKLFLTSGAKVLMVDRSESDLRQAMASLEVEHANGSNPANIKTASNGSQLKDRVAFFAADVSTELQVKASIHMAVEKFAGIDVLFANAGIEGEAGALCDLSEEQFMKVLNVNVKGVWLYLKHAAPVLKKRGGGSIIITSSVAGLRGSANLGPYVTSKHALMGLMKCAAAELGPANIRVNTINPGPVDNRMMRSIEKQFSSDHPEAVKQGFVTKIPMGRYAMNRDIAEMALFLASERSVYCSGSSFVVDGGFTAC